MENDLSLSDILNNKYFQNILSCTYDGKMKHDDGVDSTAQLCDMIYSNRKRRKHGFNGFRNIHGTLYVLNSSSK